MTKAEEDTATAQAEVEQERQSQPAPAPAPELESNNSDVSAPFKYCIEARAAGAARVYRGEPG